MRETIALIDRLVSLDPVVACSTLGQLLCQAEREGEAEAVATIEAILFDIESRGRVIWPDLEGGAA